MRSDRAAEQGPQPEDEQPWASPLPGENARWFQRFSRYLALGPGRSVRAVYNAEQDNKTSKAVPATWREATKRYEWLRRAGAYDAWQRQQLLSQSFARDTERISRVSEILEAMHQRLLAKIAEVEITDRNLDRLLDRYVQLLDFQAKQTGGYPLFEPEPKPAGAADAQERPMQVLFYLPRVAVEESGEIAPDSESTPNEKKEEESDES